MTKEDITREIAEVLELPNPGYKGKAWKIVSAVIQAMTEALQRGESIRIDGLGTFRVRTRRPTRRTHYFFPYLGKGRHVETNDTPEKKYVFFQPAKPIVRTINGRDDC